MSDRGIRLHQDADDQITELIRLLSAGGEHAFRLPCRARQKLGDGTVGATARHTTDNYHRIAAYIAATVEGRPTVTPAHDAIGHPAAGVDLDELVARLRAARRAVAFLARLSDEQLDQVPPANDMRFVDGSRTVEQIVAGVLRHQQHQVDAIAATLALQP
jgi:hypothetical protein